MLLARSAASPAVPLLRRPSPRRAAIHATNSTAITRTRRVLSSSSSARQRPPPPPPPATNDTGLSLRMSALVGTLSGIMSGLTGAGGGIVLIPVLAKLTTMSQQTINGTQAGAVAFSVALGAFNHLQAGACNFPLALATTIPSVVFAGVGVKLAHRVPSRKLSLAVGLAMLACAPVMVFKNSPRFPKFGGEAHSLDLTKYRSSSGHEYFELVQNDPLGFASVNFKYVVAGCFAGFISGLVGIGGGILVTAYLTAASDMPQEAIIGTSMLSILPTAGSAAYFNWRAKSVHVPTAVRLGASLGLSVFLTSKFLTHHVPEEILRDLLGATLGTAALVMLRRRL